MKNDLQPWRKPYMTILTILTIAAVLGGVVYHVYGWKNSALGKLFHSSSWSRQEELSKDSTNDIVKLDGTVKDIKIDCDMADCSIVYGDELSVKYDYPANCIPSVKMDGTTLKVTETNHIKLSSGFDRKCTLIITVPSNSKLNDVNIDVNMGNIEFSDISCEKLTAVSNMGNIELSGITADKFVAEVDMGNIEVSNMTCDTVDFDCSMGNVEFRGTAKNVKADCDMGNVEIYTDNADAKIDADADLGNCVVNGVEM